MAKRPRTLDSFFSPPQTKRSRLLAESSIADHAPAETTDGCVTPRSEHPEYPFSIPRLPTTICDVLDFSPATEGRLINHQPDLDLMYFQPYVPKDIERELFEFLRKELFFYRVNYSIKRGSIETRINTPRFTTVFGVDETSRFDARGQIMDAFSNQPIPKDSYRCRPRPIPQCLDKLRILTENATGCDFNFVLVNYYASGNDSISYHSDDERFLGPNPAIASFSLGAKRDFLMRHKPTPSRHSSETNPMKFSLGSGDMILMRGGTQSNWLHSIPKRKGTEADKGRINITFRRAMIKGGTENYYRYNVGDGDVYRWNMNTNEMIPWKVD